MTDPHTLVPKDKADTSSIAQLAQLSPQDATPILEELLCFLQDRNWPVAEALMEVLPRFHRGLVPHVRQVLLSGDDIWKYWVLDLVRQFPAESSAQLRPELERMAQYPTTNEMYEEVDEKARLVLDDIRRVEEESGRLGYGAEISGEVYSYVTTFRVVRQDCDAITCRPGEAPNLFLVHAPQAASPADVQGYVQKTIEEMHLHLAAWSDGRTSEP